MQRLACGLIGLALLVFAGLGAMLLGDSFAPARLPPLLACFAAAGAGVVLMLGLALLHHRAPARRHLRFG